MAHALLSASASSRWLNCPPSARLAEALPDSASSYAAEGSLAHEIAELKLRKYFLEPLGPRAFSNRLKKIKEQPKYAGLYQEEMQRHTDAYLDYLKKLALSYPAKPYVAVEKQIDYSAYAPEGFGTCDCILIGGETMHVVDFKYGKGVAVSAEHNSQMLLYALGALSAYSLLYAIQTVKLAIVQPRLDSISEWELSADELRAWGEQMKPIAQQAYKGEGAYTPGAHCRFCRAKAQCRARAEAMLSLEAYGNKPPSLLADSEVGKILARAEQLDNWVSALKEYALSALLTGGEIPGWKAVEGRAARVFSDQDKAFEVLKQNGVVEAMLYERRPLTLAAVEKLVGKKRFEEMLAEYIVRQPGKPTLAPAGDKREAITNQMTAEEAFKNII